MGNRFYRNEQPSFDVQKAFRIFMRDQLSIKLVAARFQVSTSTLVKHFSSLPEFEVERERRKGKS